MINFFKKKDKYQGNLNELLKVLSVVFLKFNDIQSQKIIEAIRNGLIVSINSPRETVAYNYFKFGLNINIVNQYQDINSGQYSIVGIKVWDKIKNKFLDLEVLVFNGLVMGVALPNEIKNFEFDSSKIVTKFISKINDEDDSLSHLKSLLSKHEIDILKDKNVFILDIEGKTYYHIKSLEDGDFIGLDVNGHVCKLTHDPFSIEELDVSIKEIFGPDYYDLKK